MKQIPREREHSHQQQSMMLWGATTIPKDHHSEFPSVCYSENEEERADIINILNVSPVLMCVVERVDACQPEDLGSTPCWEVGK